MVPEPVSTAATVISAANGIRSLFGGGGSKQSSVHQGWRVQGTLTRDGLSGTNTAWDQLGNTWGGAIEGGWTYAPIFQEYLGNSNDQIPIDLTVSAGEGYVAGLTRQLREAFSALGPIKQTPAAPAPVLPPLEVPASLFDPDPTADTPARPTIAAPSRPATSASLGDWLSDLLGSAPAAPVPANNLPPMSTIVPPSMQANQRQSSAPATPAQPGAFMALAGVAPLLILGAVALYLTKG